MGNNVITHHAVKRFQERIDKSIKYQAACLFLDDWIAAIRRKPYKHRKVIRLIHHHSRKGIRNRYYLKGMYNGRPFYAAIDESCTIVYTIYTEEMFLGDVSKGAVF